MFQISEGWSGWFCPLCSWNRALPCDPEERLSIGERIRLDFLNHNCEPQESGG